MKILHVIDSRGFGGAERYIIDLCSKFQELSNVEVMIVTFFFNKYISELSNQKMIHYSFLCDVDDCSNAVIMRKIRQLYNQNLGSIYHTHGYRANILVRSSLFFTKARIVTTVHSTLKYWKNPVKKKIYSLLDKSTSVRNQKIIAVSEYIRKYYKTRFNQFKIETVYNGVDQTIFLARKNAEFSEVVQLVNVGSLNNVKNQITVLKAMNYLINDLGYMNIKLLLIGEGPTAELLKDYIHSNNLKSNVKMTGFVNNVESYLKKSDIFISSSTDESFGLSIVEAMLTGIPVVASAVGGVPEIITDGVTGFLYSDPFDYIELSKKITRIIDNKELYHSIANNGNQQAVEHFTLDIQAKKILELYESI